MDRLVRVFFILLFLFVNSGINASKNDFSGKWCWNKNDLSDSFRVFIRKVNNRYYGSYLFVAYHGRRVDENNKAFNFKATLASHVQTSLSAGVNKSKGKIQLVIQNNKTIEWRVLKATVGEFFLPSKALLERCS